MKVVRISDGLGNQMFQIAYGKYLEINFNEIVMFNISHFRFYRLRPLELPIFYNINNLIFIEEKIISKNTLKFIEKKEFYFYGNPDLNNYFYFVGFWQSYKYCEKIRKELLEIFNFPKIVEKENIKMKKIIEKNNSVSLHIRRTDYLSFKNKKKFYYCDENYFDKAIKIIKHEIKNPIFFIFSDDISWCKKNFNKLENKYFIDWNKKNKNFRDMQLISLCKHNIISNSSFSWWGAWLNKNEKKIIISPKKWINNVSSNKICPKEWIKI